MRRLLAALLLPLLLLVACGDDGGSTDVSSDDPTSDDADPGGTGPVDPGDPDDTGPVTPAPGLVDPRPTAIDSVVVAAGGDGDKLEVAFYNGVQDCYGLDRVEVVETDTTVTIGVFTGSRPPGDQVCIDIAELQTTVVTLDAPLGDRDVVDASTAAAVPVG